MKTTNGWVGENYDSNLTTKDITAKIRLYLKKEFPECKFSVTKENSTFTDSIYIDLMEAPEDVLIEKKDCAQVNYYWIDESKKLTEYGKKLLKNVVSFAQSYNYDDSDTMTDYFDTGFYLNIGVGKWNKPFKVVKR